MMAAIDRLMSPLLCAGALLALAGCHERTADGTRPEDLRDLRDFDEIMLAGSDHVIVRQGKDYSVTAQGDPRALARLAIKQHGKTLEVGRKSDWRSIMPGADGGATVTVTVPALREARLAGSGDMRIEQLSGKEVEATVAGSGTLAIAQIAADKADLEIAGSGNLTASGEARQAHLSVTGSGDLIAPGLVVQAAELSLTGSGDVQLRVDGTAAIAIIGSGNATIGGTGRCTVTRLGSGTARCGG